jgi:flavorubredoxin
MRGQGKALKILLQFSIKLISDRRFRRWQYLFYRAVQVLKEVTRMNNALIIYCSNTGNTEKVALAIQKGLERADYDVTVKGVDEAAGEALFNYDLVCFGSPVIDALPPDQVVEYLNKAKKECLDAGELQLASPRLLNKNALVFCTYSGPHCGINEALPAGKYIRQFFEHLGFTVKAEWYEVGEFHGWPGASTKGRHGDIRGRPDEDDLALVELKTIQLAKSL